MPGTGDDVFLDANSGTGTITCAAPDGTAKCRNLDCTGYAGTLTGNQLNINASAGGTIKFSSTMTVGTLGLAILSASGANSLFTTGGKSFSFVNYVNSTTGGVTLQDGLTITGGLGCILSSGNLNTNGQTCFWTIFNSNNSTTRSLTLGTSNITITSSGTAWNITTSTGMTLSASTSTITFTGASPTFQGGAKTYNNLVFSGSGSPVVVSGFTCANFTRTGTATKTDGLVASNSFTVTGTCTLAGNSLSNRLAVQTSALGSPRSITAAAGALLFVDLADITGAGAATWAGSSVGDLGGNTNINFTPAITRYGVAPGNWSSTSMWAASSGGALAAYRAQIIGDGPYAYWRLGETSGPTAADEMGLHNGTWSGTPSLGTAGALSGDSNGSVGLASSSSAAVGALGLSGFSNFTMEAWVKWTGNTTNQWVLGEGSSSTNVPIVGLVANFPSVGKLFFQVKNDAGVTIPTLSTPASTYNDGNWHHVVGTMTWGSLASLYVDGALVATSSGVGVNLPVTLNTFTIGGLNRIGSTTNFFTGSVDEPACYRYVMSAAQVAAHYAMGNTGSAIGMGPPLPQDTARFDANAAAGTYSIDEPRACGMLDCTGFTRSLTPTVAGATLIYGSVVWGSGMTLTAGTGYTLAGRGMNTVQSNGKTWTNSPNVAAITGTYTLLDDLVSLGNLTLGTGTFDASSRNVTLATLFNSTSSGVRALHMGSGIWTLTGTGIVWNTGVSTNMTMDPGTSTIVIGDVSASAKSFITGALANPMIVIPSGGLSSVSISGSSASFASMSIAPGRTVFFQNGKVWTVGGLDAVGTLGMPITMEPDVPGTTWTIIKNGAAVVCNYLVLSGSIASGTATFYAGAQSIDAGGNTGWIFTNVPLAPRSKQTIIVPDWRFLLAKSTDLSNIGELTQARSRILQVTLNAAGSFNFALPLIDDRSNDVQEITTCVLCQRNSQPRGHPPLYQTLWSGPVWTIVETTPNAIQVGCVGWLQTLAKRLIKPGLTDPITGNQYWGPATQLTYSGVSPGTGVDPGAIAFDLLERSNAEAADLGGDNFVNPGNLQESINVLPTGRTRTYDYGAAVLDEINNLSAIESGYDYDVDPVTRGLDIYFGNVAGELDATIYGRGHNRKDAVFGFGSKSASNLEQASRASDSSKLCNRMIVVGQSGITAIAQDMQSISKYGLLEETTSISDTSDLGVLQAFANAEVAVRSTPLRLINIVPRAYSPDNPDPRIFTEFDPRGDIVYATLDRGRLQLSKQAARCFGATISFSDSGSEKISALQTQAQ